MLCLAAHGASANLNRAATSERCNLALEHAHVVHSKAVAAHPSVSMGATAMARMSDMCFLKCAACIMMTYMQMSTCLTHRLTKLHALMFADDKACAFVESNLWIPHCQSEMLYLQCFACKQIPRLFALSVQVSTNFTCWTWLQNHLQSLCSSSYRRSWHRVLPL